MNIFRKRPLCLILCIILGGFSLFLETDLYIKLLLIGISALIFICNIVFPDLFKSARVITAVASVAFICAILLGQLYVYLSTPSSYFGKTAKIVGQVTDIENKATSGEVITLQVFFIENNPADCKFIIYVDREDVTSVTEGSVIEFYGAINEFKTSSSVFDERSYYLSRGYNGAIYNITDIKVLEETTPPLNIFREIQRFVTDRFVLATDKRTGGFLAALLMGDKTYLHPSINLNFQLIGISHILALSGMHLVILCGAVKGVLTRLGFNKKTVVLISTLFALFYMSVTGFSASVVRSAVMLAITNLLFLFMSTNDGYTTLPLSVIIILLFEPYAVYDLSLWLSAFATLGIMLFSDMEKRRTDINADDKPSLPRAILLSIRESILATIFSMCAVYLLMAFFFKKFSILAPITTLIYSIPINLMIFMAIILLFIPGLSIYNTFLIWYTEIIVASAEFFSDITPAIIFIDYPIVQVSIILLSVFYFGIMIVKVENFKRVSLMLTALYLISSVLSFSMTRFDQLREESYFSVSTSENSFIIRSHESLDYIYFGDYSTSSAYGSYENLVVERALKVDRLIIPTYSNTTDNFIDAFLANNKTDYLYLPTPIGTDECVITEYIADTVSLYGTTVVFYEIDEFIELGEYKYLLSCRKSYHGTTSDCIYTIVYKDNYYTYFSDGATETLPAYARMWSSQSDYFIFGSIGSKTEELIGFGTSSTRLKGVIYFDSHPLNDEAIEYLKMKEVPIIKIDTSYFIH